MYDFDIEHHDNETIDDIHEMHIDDDDDEPEKRDEGIDDILHFHNDENDYAII